MMIPDPETIKFSFDFKSDFSTILKFSCSWSWRVHRPYFKYANIVTTYLSNAFWQGFKS